MKGKIKECEEEIKSLFNTFMHAKFLTILIMVILVFEFSYLIIIFDYYLDYILVKCNIQQYVAVIAIIIFQIFFFISLIDLIKIQKIHNLPSWFGISLFTLNISIILIFMYRLFFSYSMINNIYYLITSVCFLGIELSICLWFSKPKKLEFTEFGHDTVGINEDKFDFKISAEKEAYIIENSKRQITTICISGEYGEGKSSFTRMIIEKLDPKKCLYTRISTLETNEYKDLLRLFEKKWIGTLKERYPIMNFIKYEKYLDSVLNISNSSIVKDILKICKLFDVALFKTIKIDSKKDLIPHYNTKLFADIPVFKEKQWVIVFDEIERCKLEEIYHIIKIIERFKLKSINGFPINLTIIVCISRIELEKYLTKFEKKDQYAFLIKEYFIDNLTKNFNYYRNIPVKSHKAKIRFLKSELDKIEIEFYKKRSKDYATI